MSKKNNLFSFRLIGWIPAITWLVILFRISSMPGDRLSLPVFPFADKLIHFGAYFFAGVLLQCRGAVSTYLFKRPAVKIVFTGTGLLLGICHAVLTEYYQLFVPLRDFSYWDMAANITGCLAGIFMAVRLQRV